MTLVARDEADIVDAQISYHLNAGVDFVIAIDHRSVDGTTEILQSFARDGYLRLMRRDDEHIRQAEWVTYLARLAATEHEADWVINSDADEFWWPRASSLKEALGAVPASYGVVYAPMCYFLPRRGSGPFYDVMTVRLLQGAPINNPLSRYRPSVKAAHRASEGIVVLRGNHEVEHGGRRLTSWYPLEMFHFPDRSPEQCARKYANTVSGWPMGGREPGAFVLAAQNAMERGGIEENFDNLAVTDADLTEAARDRTLAHDTRLRDVLRRLRSNANDRFLLPHEVAAELEMAPPSPLDDTRHSLDVSALAAADLIRMSRNVDDLGRRAAGLGTR